MTKVRYNGSVPSACAEGGEVTAAGKVCFYKSYETRQAQYHTARRTKPSENKRQKVHTKNKISQSKIRQSRQS